MHRLWIALAACALVLIAASSRGGVVPGVLASSGAKLKLPQSAFTPASVVEEFVLKNNNPLLTDTTLFPRAYHSKGYNAWGRITGYYQGGRLGPNSSTSHATFRYAASLFKDVKGARTAWEDASSYGPSRYSSIKVLPCPDGIRQPCTRWLRSDLRINYVEVFQVKRCLIEMNSYVERSAFALRRKDMLATLADMDRAALHVADAACKVQVPTPTPRPTPRPTPGPMSCTFDSLSVQNAQGVVEKTLHVNHQLFIVSTFTVRNLGTPYAQGKIQRTYRGRSQTATTSDTVTVVNGRNPPNRHEFKPAATGPLHITVTITIGKIRHQRSVDIQIAP